MQICNSSKPKSILLSLSTFNPHRPRLRSPASRTIIFVQARPVVAAGTRPLSHGSQISAAWQRRCFWGVRYCCGFKPSASNCRLHSAGASRSRSMLMPRNCLQSAQHAKEGPAKAGRRMLPNAAGNLRFGRRRFVHASVMFWFFSGNDRMRLPVAAKIALSTAGAATKIVGSPTPPQNPPDGMIMHSTFGISLMRIEL